MDFLLSTRRVLVTGAAPARDRHIAASSVRPGAWLDAIAPGYLRTEISERFPARPAGGKIARRIPLELRARPVALCGAPVALPSNVGRSVARTSFPVDHGHLALPI